MKPVVEALCTDYHNRKAKIVRKVGQEYKAWVYYGTRRVWGRVGHAVDPDGKKLKPLQWLFSADEHHVLDQFPEA